MVSKQCFWCGDDVDRGDYDYIGPRLVYVCSSRECQRELANEHQASYEDAAERLRDDYFGR